MGTTFQNNTIQAPDAVRGGNCAVMKLMVAIPALNEEKTIANVIGRIPRDLPGIDEIRVVVVDDGSTDKTCELAREAGADVISHGRNIGVGRAFQSAVLAALERRVDFMVNIDGDGQFNPEDIRLIVEPLVAGQADFVTASRFLKQEFIPEMPKVKLYGNHMMSWLVSKLCGRKFFDVSCGFRGYTRDALLRLNLFGDFTYTQETFLDLSFKGLVIREVPVKIRGVREFGKSRVASNLFAYAGRTSKILFRSFRDYKPMIVFGGLAVLLLLVAAALMIFLLVHYFRTGAFTPHKWAGFTAGTLAALSFITLSTGLIADMLGRIRLNQEKMMYMMKRNG